MRWCNVTLPDYTVVQLYRRDDDSFWLDNETKLKAKSWKQARRELAEIYQDYEIIPWEVYQKELKHGNIRIEGKSGCTMHWTLRSSKGQCSKFHDVKIAEGYENSAKEAMKAAEEARKEAKRKGLL